MAVKKVVQMLEAVNYAIVMILKFRHISKQKRLQRMKKKFKNRK